MLQLNHNITAHSVAHPRSIRHVDADDALGSQNLNSFSFLAALPDSAAWARFLLFYKEAEYKRCMQSGSHCS